MWTACAEGCVSICATLPLGIFVLSKVATLKTTVTADSQLKLKLITETGAQLCPQTAETSDQVVIWLVSPQSSTTFTLCLYSFLDLLWVVFSCKVTSGPADT